MQKTFFFTSFSAFLLFTILWLSCKKTEESGVNTDILIGFVKKIHDGSPIANAKLTFNGQNVHSSNTGYFQISKKDLSRGRHYIAASVANYFNGGKIFEIEHDSAQIIEIYLTPKNNPASFETDKGLASTVAGIYIEIPPNAIELQSGGAYTGSCNLDMVYIDPFLSRGQMIPGGSLLAKDNNNQEQLLLSLGMFGATLTGPSGEALQIIPGKKVLIKMPAAVNSISSAPATVPTWHFDESSGYWKQEGEAVLEGSNYVFEVGHFSFWNVDVPSLFVKIKGRILVNKQPIDALPIRITCEMGGVWQEGYGNCDQNGYFEGYVPKDVALNLRVYDLCQSQTLTELNIDALSTDFTLQDIFIGTETLDVPVTVITANLLDCNNIPIPFGSASIWAPHTGNSEKYMSKQYVANAEGIITIHIQQCHFETFDIRFNNNVSDSTVIIYNSTTPNLGNIVICD